MSETSEPVAGQTTESKVGRPSTYTQDLADEICAELSMGKSIRTVCAGKNMPAISTFFKWLREHDEFSKQYARAKEEAADAMAEDVLYIADTQERGTITTIKADGSVESKEEDMLGHRRLQIDTRKWLMAKMKPKKYGEKLDVTSANEKIGLNESQADQLLRLRNARATANK